MREPLDIMGTTGGTIAQFSEGNPGALSVLISVFRSQGQGMLVGVVVTLDSMNMRGEQLYAAYKYFADTDLDRFINAVIERDPEMVSLVNRMCDYSGEIAVVPEAIDEEV